MRMHPYLHERAGRRPRPLRWLAVLWFVVLGAGHPAWGAHGYALWDRLQYPPDFAHFRYVNPDAPKGGELRLVSNLRTSTFDKYNPFTLRGSAPAYLADLMFDTLLVGPADELGAAYGLLAEDVAVAPDRLSVTFRLRPQARFHNGDPVLAEDVRHSFDTLIGPHVSPAYRTLLADVAGVDVLGPRVVRFRFRVPNRELPLIVGGLPIFSRAWGDAIDPRTGQRKTFDQVVTDIPIGSGPYRIGPVKFGRDITYVRDPDYWARDLPVRRGQFNFDRVTVKIYKDNTARLEALKAGEFDLMRFFSAGDWARRVSGKRFDSGELVKGEFRHRLPTGFQSYVLNTRRPPLDDIRVRQALGLALDFEWMNERLFYGSYQRVRGLFGNTACAAEGPPDAAQRALLQPWRGQVPEAVFGPMAEPPRTDGAAGLRANLKRAQALLREAGWTFRDGALRNAQGQPLVLEYLDSNEAGVRVVTPWARNLARIGVELRFRSVDFALYQQRLRTFDFDIISLAFQGTHNPGAEYADLFGSEAARTPDSGNFTGLANPAVDDLIQRMVQAQDEPAYLAACRALERVIAHSHVLIPQWSAPTHRLAYNAWRLQPTPTMPPYASGEGWAIATWWARQPPVVPARAQPPSVGVASTGLARAAAIAQPPAAARR
ncbi:extracellular solute-binding protein [Tepidimonas charontis]|uniref:Heme-binding protein A n=1 Tax=Tepidimonas charontis TaxID=2267262 RepID=A0A554XJB8_9BURK|nr:extracellular solute-binding protein [Tepidimonas charontis]TSE35899.1 Heme-binding protein A [Tepidimonas charontis]